MADAYQTANRKFYVGNTTYLADLSEFANSIEAAGDARIEKLTVVGNSGVESVPLTLQYMFRVPVMYYGDEPKKLLESGRDTGVNYAALIYPDTNTHLTMGVVYPGLATSAPTDNVLTHNVEFSQNLALCNGGPKAVGSTTAAAARVIEFFDAHTGNTGLEQISITATGNRTIAVNTDDTAYFVATEDQYRILGAR